MKISRNGLFSPPRILTCVNFSRLALFLFCCLTAPLCCHGDIWGQFNFGDELISGENCFPITYEILYIDYTYAINKNLNPKDIIVPANQTVTISENIGDLSYYYTDSTSNNVYNHPYHYYLSGHIRSGKNSTLFINGTVNTQSDELLFIGEEGSSVFITGSVSQDYYYDSSFIGKPGSSVTISSNFIPYGANILGQSKLKLTDDAIPSRWGWFQFIVDKGSILEFNVPSGTKSIGGEINCKHLVGEPQEDGSGFVRIEDIAPLPQGNGQIVKSGDGTLQIDAGYGYNYYGTNQIAEVNAESFVISSGRVDYQGYFGATFTEFDFKQHHDWGDGYEYWAYEHVGDYETIGKGIVVEGPTRGTTEGATLSPGAGYRNTIGAMYTTTGITIESGAIMLFEFDAYSENSQPSKSDGSGDYDTLYLIDSPYTYVFGDDANINFVVENGGLINLAFLNDDAKKWAEQGNEYQIIFDERTEYRSFTKDADLSAWLGNYQDMFRLESRAGQGLFLVGLIEPEIPVPEPSTWALLILGAAGLMYLRKRVRS